MKMNWNTDEMLKEYVTCCEQTLEAFNILLKVDLGMIKREDVVLPIGLIEKRYKALDEYTKVLGLSLNLLGVQIPDIN